jgi:hypothetical protein
MKIRYSPIFVALWAVLSILNIALFAFTGSPQSALIGLVAAALSLSTGLRPLAQVERNAVIVNAMIGPAKKRYPYDRLEVSGGQVYAILGSSRRKIGIGGLLRRKADWDEFLARHILGGKSS